MNPADIIALSPPFRDATPERRQELSEDVTGVHLTAGMMPFRTGDTCRAVAFVGEGRIKVSRVDLHGREITLYHVGPGEACLLTLNSALTGDTYPADGIVEADVTAALLPVDRFHRWFDDDTRFRDFVIRTVASRTTELMELVEHVAFDDVRTRLARHIMSTAPPERGYRIDTTHDLLAAEVGASRETVSRILKECERAGLVTLGRGSVRVLNPVGLLRGDIDLGDVDECRAV